MSCQALFCQGYENFFVRSEVRLGERCVMLDRVFIELPAPGRRLTRLRPSNRARGCGLALCNFYVSPEK